MLRKHLREILDSSPKYEHLLKVIKGKAEEDYQNQDKFVIGSAYPVSAFLIESVCVSFLQTRGFDCIYVR